ncbi:MAG: UUP1 family membrane protein [Leptolyngbya sp. SIO4C1]|nr:UUP1 family membrane protein [Leptolyngbya sp. SIO4C1]
MNRTRRTLFWALLLAAASLAIFFHKLFTLDLPLLPNQTQNRWYLETQISLEKTVENPDFELYLPQNSQRYRLVSETLENPGFTHQIEASAPNRLATYTAQSDSSPPTLFYRAVVEAAPIAAERPASVASTIGNQLVDEQLDQVIFNNARRADDLQENPPEAAIKAILQTAQADSNSRLSFAEAIYQRVVESTDQRVQLLQETLGFEQSAAAMAAFLLERAEIPARVGNGILMTTEEAYSTSFIHWLEVHSGGQWLAYDAVTQEFGPQDRYLLWWYGNQPVIKSPIASQAAVTVVVRPNTDAGLTTQLWQADDRLSPWVRYSLVGLPLVSQHVFQVLVLVPIGALVVAVIHQMVGLRTLGTFTPILIALSFRETGLLTGVGLFLLVIAMGLLIRAFLHRLQLMVVPRLGAILTATVLIMAGLAILFESLNLELGLSISLFPIVILAMAIERSAVMWEEEGAKETAIASGGTLLVAIAGFLIVGNRYVQHLAFVFPELLLPVFALNLLVGRYNGYRLSEYFRFQSLRRQLEAAKG